MVSSLHKLLDGIQMDNGRCAIGVIMSYFGWNGKDMIQADKKLLGVLIALRSSGIDKNLLIELNDSGRSFEEIADFLDKVSKKPMYGMQKQ